MLVFGLITILQGFAQSFSGLIAARFFLGLAECGVFPACFYLIAMWYPRAETQKSPTAICVGLPVPSTGKSAVTSFELPSPAKEATSCAPEKLPSGAKTSEESVGEWER